MGIFGIEINYRMQDFFLELASIVYKDNVKTQK